MALYAIGDTHLSLGGSKAMDKFPGWEGYVTRLEETLGALREEDVLVLCGDVSWGMSLEESRPDFAFLNSFPPRRKILLKGNHDYWWTTAGKMTAFFAENGWDTFELLHNNCILYGETALCGTRGWFLEEEQTSHNEKVFQRELIRLETSLKAAGEREKICFLHYPPRYQGYECPQIIQLMEQYRVKACFYGHLHGPSHRLAVEGSRGNVDYHLVAADFLRFVPKKIMD